MKFKKSDAPKSYIIEQGMYSPSADEVGWRQWSAWTDLDEAKNELRGYRIGIWRIIEAREIFVATGSPKGKGFPKTRKRETAARLARAMGKDALADKLEGGSNEH